MENETVNENMSRIKSPLYLTVCVNTEQRRMMAGFSPQKKNAEACRSHFCQFDEKSEEKEEE
jgi:hypothetical protein